MKPEKQKLTLRHIVDRSKTVAATVVSKWVWILVASMIGACAGLFISYLDTPTYSAPIKFMVNEDDSNTSRGISSMLGSLGFGIGGGGSSANLDKILEIATSNLITQKVLLDSVKVNGQEASIIDHIIDKYGLSERILNKYPNSKGLRYYQLVREDSLMSNFIFKNIERQLIGTKSTPGFLTTTADDVTGMMLIEAVTVDQELSISIVETFYKELSKYYIARAIEPQKATLEKIQKKVDSLRADVLSKEMSLARLSDASKGLFLAKDKVKQGRLSSDVNVSTVAYSEAVRNLEIASFSMETSTPYFQVVDRPYLPIDANFLDRKKSVFLGFLIGLFLGLSAVICIMVFQILLSE